MPVPARRTTPVAAPSQGVDFGSMHSPIYSGSFVLPEGDWAVWFDLVLQQPKEGSTFQKQRLGVRLSCINLAKPTAEPTEQFLSMGSKAHESFLPSEDGKSLIPVVGGPGNLTNKSNWNLFRDSLYNSGLPVGIFSDNLSVLDGIWVHTAQEAEPEERKGFQSSSTGEAAQEQPKTLGKIPVVTAILDGGAPWEGGGGMPEATPAKATPARAVATAPKAAPARPAPVRAAAPVAAEVVAGDAGDPDSVQNAAINAITDVLTQDKYKASCPKLILKTSVFKIVGDKEGKDMAQAVTNTYFSDDAELTALLEQLDYTLVGTAVKPKA